MMTKYAEVVFNIPTNKSFTYILPDNFDRDALGFRVVASLGRKKLTGCVISTGHTPPRGGYTIKIVDRIIDKESIIDQKLIDLARWMSMIYMCSLGQALFVIVPGGRREIDRGSGPDAGGWAGNTDFILADQQRRAIDTILSQGPGSYYLQGVTGSGKTEVFLRVAEELRDRGLGIIYLVPEISLVHQVVEAFKSNRLGEVAVLHSGLTMTKRLTEWRRVLKGKAKIVIGARSAVFAPVRKLGLIVVDEEHENSYKAGSTPRYHARQVAAYRCEREGAILVMGSATPSLPAYFRMETGKLKRLSLTKRLSGGCLPRIEVVDMKQEQGILSARMIRMIREVHSERRQTILFLNRRGFSYFFFCRSCGYEMKCRNCSVALTFHKNKNMMICHYCGYRIRPENVCPECGSLDIGYSGFGTERIEEEIGHLFPDMSFARIDSDSVKRKGDLQETLRSFRNGDLDLLLGTQMVAKGLNFPGVKLVGIVLADTGFQLPDYSAMERTFTLIVQVSGRAGRMTQDGVVLVQTFKPESTVIKRAAAGQLKEFYGEELSMRRLLGFPPHVRFIRIVVRGKERAKALAAAKKLRESSTANGHKNVEILGPVECPISVISGNHRFHIIFRGKNFTLVHALVYELKKTFVVPRGVFLEIDVDPMSLL